MKPPAARGILQRADHVQTTRTTDPQIVLPAPPSQDTSSDVFHGKMQSASPVRQATTWQQTEPSNSAFHAPQAHFPTLLAPLHVSLVQHRRLQTKQAPRPASSVKSAQQANTA